MRERKKLYWEVIKVAFLSAFYEIALCICSFTLVPYLHLYFVLFRIFHFLFSVSQFFFLAPSIILYFPTIICLLLFYSLLIHSLSPTFLLRWQHPHSLCYCETVRYIDPWRHRTRRSRFQKYDTERTWWGTYSNVMCTVMMIIFSSLLDTLTKIVPFHRWRTPTKC